MSISLKKIVYNLIIMENEYKLDVKNIKNQVKSIATVNDLTLTKLKELVNKKYNRNDSVLNLRKKLTNKTIKLPELEEVLDILGYEIVIKKKEKFSK